MSIRPTAFTWLRSYQTAWLATDAIAERGLGALVFFKSSFAEMLFVKVGR